MKEIKLSLIIATFNRGKQLINTLGSLTSQTLPENLWEIIIVNNNSVDDTIDLFNKFTSDYPNVNICMVRESLQGLSFARNRGIKEAKGKYIIIIDDDEEVGNNYLEEYYDLFENRPEVAAAGGKIIAKYDFVLPNWLSPYTERPITGILDLGNNVIPFPIGKFFGGGNMGIRRSMLEKYGYFNTTLGRKGNLLIGGEEKDLYMRLKEGRENIYYIPKAVIYHIIPLERLTINYLKNACKLIGTSEKIRTKNISKREYLKRLWMELVKWGGTVILSFFYLIRCHPSKASALIIMRSQITTGLLS